MTLPAQRTKRSAPACRERPNWKKRNKMSESNKTGMPVWCCETWWRDCKRTPKLDSCVKRNANMWRMNWLDKENPRWNVSERTVSPGTGDVTMELWNEKPASRPWLPTGPSCRKGWSMGLKVLVASSGVPQEGERHAGRASRTRGATGGMRNNNGGHTCDGDIENCNIPWNKTKMRETCMREK